MYIDFGRHSDFWKILGIKPGNTTAPLPDAEVLGATIDGITQLMLSVQKLALQTSEMAFMPISDEKLRDVHARTESLTTELETMALMRAGLEHVRAGGEPAWTDFLRKLPTFWAVLEARGR